ncbi:hypothetical protein GCM10008013_27960 [Paenibacillus segetis]|uniref:Uncharacterized protein n=1 Tax=Paenibacillus segetis TaxID=1325360 RepID=A0ABQ1YI58_9BACL|nr:hypothetical protein GCM10008013_27960 [Paenibacillus segetis]
MELYCPHYDKDTHAEDFMSMVPTKDTAKAYTIIDTDQGVNITELAQHPSFNRLVICTNSWKRYHVH